MVNFFGIYFQIPLTNMKNDEMTIKKHIFIFLIISLLSSSEAVHWCEINHCFIINEVNDEKNHDFMLWEQKITHYQRCYRYLPT